MALKSRAMQQFFRSEKEQNDNSESEELDSSDEMEVEEAEKESSEEKEEESSEEEDEENSEEDEENSEEDEENSEEEEATNSAEEEEVEEAENGEVTRKEGGDESEEEDEEHEDSNSPKKTPQAYKNDIKTSPNKPNNAWDSSKNGLGVSLFIRFPYNLPKDDEALENSVKDLCSRIIKVRRTPRRDTHACLVYFESNEDCVKGIKELRSVKINGQGLFVTKSKYDNSRLMPKDKSTVQQLIVLVVRNIPLEAKISDIKGLFPKAVNATIFSEEVARATIRFATYQDAVEASEKKYELGGNELMVCLQNNKPQFKRNQQVIQITKVIAGKNTNFKNQYNKRTPQFQNRKQFNYNKNTNMSHSRVSDDANSTHDAKDTNKNKGHNKNETQFNNENQKNEQELKNGNEFKDKKVLKNKKELKADTELNNKEKVKKEKQNKEENQIKEGKVKKEKQIKEGKVKKEKQIKEGKVKKEKQIKEGKVTKVKQIKEGKVKKVKKIQQGMQSGENLSFKSGKTKAK